MMEYIYSMRSKSCLLIALTLFTVLVPIWFSPVLVTTDGPSHIYNSILKQSVRDAQQPFASYLMVKDGWRPNRAADFILSHLGPRLGWEESERVLLSIAVTASLIVFLVLIRNASGYLVLSLVPLAAWMSQSWFAWMGFYDFSLSAGLFGALAIVLQRKIGAVHHLLIQILLGVIYICHFFTFATAVGLVITVFSWRTRVKDSRRWDILAAIPGLAVLAFTVRSGEAIAEVAPHWTSASKSLAGLLLGDFIVSFHPIAILVGATLMAAVWTVTLLRIQLARGGGVSRVTAIEIFAILLLVVSIFAPFELGEGSYVPARLRFLAVILLLPTMAAMLPLSFRAALPWAGALCMAALVMHGALVLVSSWNVNRDLNTLQSLLTEAGARPGSWVFTKLSDHERGLFRISGYTHLTDRAGLRLRLIVLDNYEAYLRVFPVNWKQVPDRLVFGPSADCWSVSLARGQMHWLGPVLVVHDANRCLVGDKGELAVGPTIHAGNFAVTRVDRLADTAVIREAARDFHASTAKVRMTVEN